jgi:hypothetical protein
MADVNDIMKDVCFALATIATAAIDGEMSLSTSALEAVAEMVDAASGAKLRAGEMAVLPNPLFPRKNSRSPVTQAYLRARAWKTMGGSIMAIAGSMTSGASHGVDAFGGAQHVNSTASTGLHLHRLDAIRLQYPDSEQVGLWLDTVERAKAQKLLIRGTQAFGALTPIPGVNIGASVVAALAKIAAKNIMGVRCHQAAQEIHWLAHQEQTKTKGKSAGPASAVVWEIFTRRTATRVLGTYDIDSLVKEPGGWMALGDKLMLV